MVPVVRLRTLYHRLRLLILLLRRTSSFRLHLLQNQLLWKLTRKLNLRQAPHYRPKLLRKRRSPNYRTRKRRIKTRIRTGRDDSDLSSLGDDLPAEAEDQDTDEERDVANRLIKHKSVNAGEEKVLLKDDKGETFTLTKGETATAKPASELSDEGMESEELIEDDPAVEPDHGRIWKGKKEPPEPVSPPATSKETKYRPTKQRRKNKMPPKGKPKAYWECPEPGTACPYCSEITDLYCRKHHVF